MNIQLTKLELTNYRNIEFASYDFSGNSKIIGDNRIGKTNTLESIYWLLTDKLLDGSSDITAIKPLKDTKLEVKVRAIFDIDGKVVTLEKRYKENWVKTRGTTNIEMKGHVEACIHNGVPQPTLKAYNQLVSEDFGFTQDATTKVDFMQMLINPYYLGNLGESKDWTELRAFIIKLVGDVSDDDVAKAKPELAPIKDDLNALAGRIDQLKKKYSNEIDGIKTQITSEDAQIDLLEKTPNPADDEVAVAKKCIEDHEEKIQALKNANGLDFASMEIGNKMNDIKFRISELEKEDLKKTNDNPEKNKLLSQKEELNEIAQANIQKRADNLLLVGKLESDIFKYEHELGTYDRYRELLINQLKDIDSKIANIKTETECPVCHRPYDADKIESLIEEAKSKLEEEKQNLIAKGKDNKYLKERCLAKLETSKTDLDKANTAQEKIESEIKETADKIEKLNEQISKVGVVEFTPNPEIEKLRSELNELESKYNESRENYLKGCQDNQVLIYQETEAMTPFKKVLYDREYYIRQMDVLGELRKARTEHAQELANAEQKKELLNQFIYTKLKMLDENVSSVFGKIKFQLIHENINGGFDAICKPYIYDPVKEESTDTSWKSGSKSERVVTGVCIAEAIKAKLELPDMPYLFDEGGEISTDTFKDRFKTESQLICVKVVDNIQKPLVQKL